MKDEAMTDALLREFLLGKLNDDECERIENLFLTVSQTKERVLALEQDLIDDFLENTLTEEDRERFLSRYAQTDEQRRQLRITKSIRDWAIAQGRVPQAATAISSSWSRFWTRLRLRPFYIVPIAAAIVIAIVLAIVWLNSRMEQRKHSAVEQELAQLNSPASLRETPPQMISVELKPVTVRSIEPQTELKLRADIGVFELHLPWTKKERYSTYQAELHRVEDDESFMIRNPQAEYEGGNVIRIRLPTHILRRGHYQIHLNGVANDGSLSPAEEYSFAVTG